MDEIIEIVCNYYKIEPSILFSKSRKLEIVKARFICFFLLKKNLKMSQQAIGNKFKMNHSSVGHGIKEVEFKREMYTDIRDEIREIWLSIKYSVDFSKRDITENIYKEIVLNLIHTDMKIFKKLKLDEQSKIWIFKDLEIPKEIIKKIQDV
jgi:hypothetical protein